MNEKNNPAPPFPRKPARGDAYIREHIKERNNRYRPKYHAAVPFGWANDPNGCCYFHGRVHLFYQHNPYAPHWDLMHWGHMVSENFLTWKELPIALGPDQAYENGGGCFSGTAIEKEGLLCLMYTGTSKDFQQQCLAVSGDGVNFTKHPENPVIPHTLVPDAFSDKDIRDPKVFTAGGKYYCLAGTKTAETGRGNILLFRSDSLTAWEPVGPLFDTDNPKASNYFSLDGVCECPDYSVIDGEEILIFSPENMVPEGDSFQNVHCSVWMRGKLDLETGRFDYTDMKELDGGFDFYAPQTFKLPDGRSILLGWKEMWGRNFPTEADGWVGSFTLPRELSMKNGKLLQQPVREIRKYRKGRVKLDETVLPEGKDVSFPDFCGTSCELVLKIAAGAAKKTGVKLFCGTDHETVLCYDRESGILSLDRSASGIPLSDDRGPSVLRRVKIGHRKNLTLHIFLDVSCLEVFVGEGEQVLTANVYPDPADTGIRFFAEGGEARLVTGTLYGIRV